jgi:hypothetical protein
MKYTARIAILSALMCLAAKAAPFMAVGDNAELFVTASAAVQADNNIYLDTNNAKSDTIFSFTPGFDLVFGKGSATTGNLYYREEIRRYSTNDVQNTQLANVGGNASYSNGVTKADFNASYAEVAQNDNDIRATGDIVQRKLTNLGAKTEFGVSEKTKLSIGLAYAKTNYDVSTYTDSSILTLPVDVYYEANPKLDWSLGYQYRSSDLSGAGRDSKDNFLNIGARGEFTPKLVGQIRLGYTTRSFDVGSKENLFGVDGSLSYLFSDKTTYKLTFSNDFSSSGTGASTKNTTFGLSVSNRFSEQWFLNSSINYRKVEYTAARTDDYIEGVVGLTYVYNNTLNLSGSVTLRKSSSDLAAAEFTNNVFSLGANVRY